MFNNGARYSGAHPFTSFLIINDPPQKLRPISFKPSNKIPFSDAPEEPDPPRTLTLFGEDGGPKEPESSAEDEMPQFSKSSSSKRK